MCEQSKPEGGLPKSDEPKLDITALIALCRAAALGEVSAIMAEVLRACLIDDRGERLKRVAEIMDKAEGGTQWQTRN